MTFETTSSFSRNNIQVSTTTKIFHLVYIFLRIKRIASTCSCLSVCLSDCLSVCLCLSTCPSVHMSVCPYACPSVYMSVCPYACLSVHPFFHLSVQLYFSLSYSVNLRYLKCYPIDDILFSKYKIRSFQRQKSEISDTLEGQTTAININLKSTRQCVLLDFHIDDNCMSLACCPMLLCLYKIKYCLN